MNQELVFQKHLIVFIDILGQREALRKIPDIPVNENEAERQNFLDSIKECLGKVVDLRKNFKEYFEEAQSFRPNTELVSPGYQEKFLAALKLPKLFKYGISDSIVISYPLNIDNENSTSNTLMGIWNALYATSGTGINAFSKNIAFRAGLDTGVATVYDKEIYGPALERAVYLENKLAEYPRFLVGDELINFLNYVKNRKAQTPAGKIANEMAKVCNEMIIRDTDGRLMIDFLGQKVKDFSKDTFDKETLVKAQDFVFSQYQKFTSEGNEKLASRYFRLLNYFQSRKDIWGLSEVSV